jgi:hypothetical protein
MAAISGAGIAVGLPALAVVARAVHRADDKFVARSEWILAQGAFFAQK